MPVQSVEAARAVLGDDVLGAPEIEVMIGALPAGADVPIPFSHDELRSAAKAGAMLVLRVTQTVDAAPLTILEMVKRFPEAFDQKLLRQMGYQLKDDWGIELEPLAASETCAPGWALVRKEILDETRNLSFELQEPALQRYAELLGVPASAVRRRSSVEIVYDTVLCFEARRVRLLEKTWDWSGSRTVDGGYLNVGGFTPAGMQILSYSRAVRHGALGICPSYRHAD